MESGPVSAAKQHRSCAVLRHQWLTPEIFRLDLAWSGPPPRAGQFFLLKPERSGLFLGRPISAAAWEPAPADYPGYAANRLRGKSIRTIRYLTRDRVGFLIARRGRGTAELAGLKADDAVELTGPLGNAWADLLPREGRPGKIALVSGGIGIAPLIALGAELPEKTWDLYAGFRTLSAKNREEDLLLGPARYSAGKITLAVEDGSRENQGRIPDFFDPRPYRAVCACGPEPMLRAVAEKCRTAGVPCFISMERRMACGVGACLGCTVKTLGGNKRCCADGPIFPAEEIRFET
jgi:NAD(P)H-flavin reductase